MRRGALIALLLLAAGGAAATPFVLSASCPASFDLTPDGRCRFISLYQMYTAAPGQGGLRVPLPSIRDGFTPQQIDLGRLLFFDPVLSGDGTLSCAHCHHPDLGYADGRATSIGAGGTGVGAARHGGTELPRSAPTLWNVGFLHRFFWDGRADSLEAQAAGPLYAANEMASSPERIERVLAGNAEYRRLFAAAFRRGLDRSITVAEVATALAAFESSLVSINSRFDRYAHGDAHALGEAEVRGWNVFRGFVGRCSQCHVPPLFSSDDLAVVGAPPSPGRTYDLGAGAVAPTNAALNGAFKVPTLRNVALTAPYFQAGQLATLADVVAFYNAPRGHAAPAGANLQLHWHVHMQRAELPATDVADLVAFLLTLTDTSMRPQVPDRVPSGLPVVPTLRQPGTKP